ncbi:MAG: hypothetical protein P1U77_08805 [Rubripirellula sp.]|nr:hypothetical protein [Rubripirellula sp.]
MAHHSALIVASEFPPIQPAGINRTLRNTNYLPDFGWELRMLTLPEDSIPGLLPRTSGDRAGKCSKVFSVYRRSGRVPNKKFNDIFGRKKRTLTASSKHTPADIKASLATVLWS